jgi:hypothetical protein
LPPGYITRVVERNLFRSFPAGRTSRSNGTEERKKRNEFRSTTKILTGSPEMSLRSITATRPKEDEDVIGCLFLEGLRKRMKSEQP